ncbi:SART-1 protein [Trichoderma sp. SZMC 28014]
MDAATIEETNRIRISLGMKPLPVPGAGVSHQASASDDDEEPGSTVESRQAQAYDNYKRVQDEEAAKKRREEKATAVRKAREKAQRFALLEGKGLGEEDQGNDLDAKAWLTGQKKRQKKIDKARKLEEELAAAEAAAAAAIQYTSKDLAGIKVAHDSTSFLDGDEQILTLKDTTIGQNEEEGDELENLGIKEQEKLTERLDLKKKLKGYNPNDYDDGEGTILAQYDEEINGKKAKRFTLDDDGAIAELSDILNQPERKGKKIQSINLNDIIDDAAPSSDYLAPSEIKVKKPKKKKGSKGTRQKQLDEDDIFPLEAAPVDASSMDIDSKDSMAKKRKATSADNFADDDDLQASLAIQRKNALKKRKKTRPEDIARQLKEDDEAPEEAQSGGLVIGEISEFVAGLSKPEDEDRQTRKQKQITKSLEADEDRDMGDGDAYVNGNEDHEMDDYSAEIAAHREEEERNKNIKQEEEEEDDAGIEDEKMVGTGMGSALALLRERGLLESQEKSGSYEDFIAREEFLSKKRVLEGELDEQTRQQRERDRMSGRLDRMSVREREEWARQQNTHRDHQQSKKMAELFNAGYKPNIELKYVDDHGRLLDRKEAFKHLSHQFHGKGSGKGKTEKRLKKIDDEKRREAQSMFDASESAGMNLATAQQLKKRREAGVRLG